MIMIKIRRRTGGMHSGMPNAPAKRSGAAARLLPGAGRLARAVVFALAILSFSEAPLAGGRPEEPAESGWFGELPAAAWAMERDNGGEMGQDVGTEPVNAAYGYKNSPVAMEASYGYDNMAKGGRYLPVYVTLTSKQETPFSGSVMIRSMESDYDIYEYEYPVTLKGEETIQINLNIPLGLRADQLYVQLYDAERNLILRKRLKMNIRQDTPELLIGTLSDSQDKLEYLNDVGIHYSTLLTRTCAMVAGSIPEQAAGLDQLDVLLITNYDIRRLSTSQIDTIKEWVSRGGILLLGTGSGGEEAVETFLEGDLEKGISEPMEQYVDMGEEFAIYGPEDVHLLLPVTRIDVKEGDSVFTSFGLPVLTSVNREKGMIAVAAYDFCDIAEFCQEHPYVDKLFTSLLGEERIQELAEYLYDGGNGIYWAVQSMINSGSVDKLPKISFYAVVIFSYILLAGPGLYFFLKQREMRKHYGRFVVLLSVCSSMLIYLMSSRTRFVDTFFNYTSVQDYSEDTIVESTYMNMRTPYNKPYSVNLDPTYDIRPLTRQTGYDNTRFTQFTGEEKENVSIYYGPDRTRLTIQDVAAFSPNYFRMEKREENTGGLTITGKLTCYDGSLKGTITNNLGIDLEQGAVFCSNSMVLIDSLKAGETVTIDDLPVLHHPLVSSFAAADRVTGGYRFEKADISSPEYMKSLRRSNLLEFYLDNSLSGYQYGGRVVAFSAGEEEGGFLLDDGYEVTGLTMYTAFVDVDYRNSEQIYHSSLEHRPEVVSGVYSYEKNTMDGLSPLTLEYSLGQDMVVERIKFVSISEEFTENPKYGDLPVFSGDIYFYNNDTGSYDKMDSSQEELIGWQLEPYLTAENTLTVKYAYDTPQDYVLDISLPVITAEGRPNGCLR